MKKINIKSIFAVVFISFAFLTGIFTIAIHPIQIVGGLARGYLDSQESDFFGKIADGFVKFDDRVNEYYIFHDISVNAYGGIQDLLGRELIDDADPNYEVVKLKNGYLTFKENTVTSYASLSEYLININQTCTANGAKLVYVNKLDKSTSDPNLLPKNYPYIYNDDFEHYEELLTDNGVSVINLENIVNEKGIEKYSLFFKSDHHWLPSSGLWGAKVINEYIEDKFGYDLHTDLLDSSNYSVESFPKSFLGSQGRRVGYLYSEIDDFEIITPNYDTMFKFNVASRNIDITGSFSEAFIRREYITENEMFDMESTPYQTYMGGNFDLVKIENLNNQEGKKCLLVMDSYGCVLAPYLSQSYKSVHCIDTRHYSDSVEDYIKEFAPDVVIYMVDWHQ